jgi:hypothetical protein
MDKINITDEKYLKNYAFHVTPSENVDSILDNGIRKQKNESKFYSEEYIDEGEYEKEDGIYFFDSDFGAIDHFNIMSIYAKEIKNKDVLPSIVVFDAPDDIDFDPEIHEDMYEYDTQSRKNLIQDRKKSNWGKRDSSGRFFGFFTKRNIPKDNIQFVCVPSKRIMERFETVQNTMKEKGMKPIENFGEIQNFIFENYYNTDEDVQDVIKTMNYGMRLDCYGKKKKRKG